MTGTLPILLPSLALGPAGSPSQIRALPTPALIQSVAAATTPSPWGWQELKTRFQAGQMSRQEISDSIEAVISLLKAQRSLGNNGPLHWSEAYLRRVHSSGLVSDEQRNRLYEANYSPINVRALPVIRHGRKLEFAVNSFSAWSLFFGNERPRMLCSVREIRRKDGTPVEATDPRWDFGPERQKHSWEQADWLSSEGGMLDGEIQVDWEPGEYELEFVIDMGVAPRGVPLAGPVSKPGKKSRWLKTDHTWQVTAKLPVKVIGPTDKLVTSTSDGTDLAAGKRIRVASVHAARGPDGE